ncbi:hypothetical protein [Glaciimonas sp. PAMC28666]|uniref:hypothetical protein n=1 Tax=Glaciimonas sp. PAMC28666 TaxID=2807626 RepID=UPI0019665AA2|nr:hypothetical protein [Glaciimonas sp. PAMC28666]QRX83255.1 hypothetical protein JQN73_02970 [Glaciimonas sp. PAMC28666]
MAAVLTTSAYVERSARGKNIAAWALIATSLVFPFIACIFGKMSAAQVGESIGQTICPFAMLALLAWLLVSRFGPIGKANGRITVGLLLCILSLTHIAIEIREENAGKRLIRQVMIMRQQKVSQFAEFSQRFRQVDLAKILSPEHMTSKVGQAAARASLDQFRSLLIERQALIANAFVEIERYFKGVPESQASKTALVGMISARDSIAPIYADLSKKQTLLADAIEVVLNWGQAQGATLTVRNGQLLFATQEQQAELQSLLGKLEKTEAEVNKSGQIAIKSQIDLQKKQERDMAGMAEYLAK